MSYDFDLFVIGGGSAGVRLARIAAGHGARVGIAEERFWGGTCVNVGCVPKKLMVMAAEYGFAAEDAAGFGWNIIRGAHDWPRFIAAKDREIERLNGVYTGLLDRAGAQIFNARARFLDSHTIMVGEETKTAERIAIATGGHPIRPDIPGADLAIVSDDAFHLPERPERVVLIGGGYIAVEFAGIFAGMGAHVDLVYRQPLPLRGFDADLRAAVAEALEASGVHLHPGHSPLHIDAHDAAKRLVTSHGDAIEGDCVFLATGRKPNTAGLGLEHVGVEVAPSGAIPIDEGFCTSSPHIFAIGDVTDRLNLTPVATAEGHTLADSLFGGKSRGVSLKNVPSAVFSIPPLATVGITEDEAPRGARIFLTRFTPMRHALTGRPRRSMMKLVVDGASDRVIGAHMLGEDAPEIIQGLAVAITAGATKADFDRTIGIHPTAAEEFVTLRGETRRIGAADAKAAE
ncbi:glutathione-disulfide reductase [Acidiphilium sp. AL]|uniref:glutathione-disulfide reductase n=1 Tax=Acidiphilium sp. AL TaxID=2871704 RepID=UPI0021CB61A6|nr:glutathione-disulfide reductase [Acidiphilium sp. AL]MCU4160886.1 glutathione-disulfide reductase [Acidiphilium sp. AL]